MNTSSAKSPSIPFFVNPEEPEAKSAILQQALKLFVAHGVEATSIRDIAKAAGYSNPALYKHYESKDALAFDLFQRCYRELSHQVDQGWDEKRNSTFEEKIAALVRGNANLLDKSPEAVLYTNDVFMRFWPSMSTQVRKKTMLTRFRDVLAQGRAQGSVSNEVPEEVHLIFIAGSLNQFARMFHLGGLTGSAQEWAPHLTTTLLKALK